MLELDHYLRDTHTQSLTLHDLDTMMTILDIQPSLPGLIVYYSAASKWTPIHTRYRVITTGMAGYIVSKRYKVLIARPNNGHKHLEARLNKFVGRAKNRGPDGRMEGIKVSWAFMENGKDGFPRCPSCDGESLLVIMVYQVHIQKRVYKSACAHTSR